MSDLYKARLARDSIASEILDWCPDCEDLVDSIARLDPNAAAAINTLHKRLRSELCWDIMTVNKLMTLLVNRSKEVAKIEVVMVPSVTVPAGVLWNLRYLDFYDAT